MASRFGRRASSCTSDVSFVRQTLDASRPVLSSGSVIQFRHRPIGGKKIIVIDHGFPGHACARGGLRSVGYDVTILRVIVTVSGGLSLPRPPEFDGDQSCRNAERSEGGLLPHGASTRPGNSVQIPRQHQTAIARRCRTFVDRHIVCRLHQQSIDDVAVESVDEVLLEVALVLEFHSVKGFGQPLWIDTNGDREQRHRRTNGESNCVIHPRTLF